MYTIGKTTLCKALAQTSFLRQSALYPKGLYLEINAHCLFSKVRIITVFELHTRVYNYILTIYHCTNRSVYNLTYLCI